MKILKVEKFTSWLVITDKKPYWFRRDDSGDWLKQAGLHLWEDIEDSKELETLFKEWELIKE